VLFKILGAPFTLPMAGVKFVFNQIADLADQELNDDGVLREQLLLLQVQLEEGDIDEDDYVEQEAVLLARLREIKARKRAQIEQVTADEMPAEANVEARRRVVVETPFEVD
jgi:gas vesicle protein GvpG